MLRASVIHPHVILGYGGLSVLNHDKRSFIAVYQSAFQKLLMHPVIQKGKQGRSRNAAFEKSLWPFCFYNRSVFPL